MSDHERSPSSRSIDLMAAQASIAIATSSIYGIKEALQGFPAPRSFLERMQHVVDELRCRPVGPTRPSRGQSLKRLLSRRGKALKSLRTEIIRSRDDFTPYRSGKGHDSNSNHDNERAWSAPGSIGEATDFVATPSPHTHPLECKPEPRDDCQYRKNMANSTVLCKRSDGSEEWPVIARDAYVRNLRKREMMAVKAAAGSKYVQEWCLYLKCYSEVLLPGIIQLS